MTVLDTCSRTLSYALTASLVAAATNASQQPTSSPPQEPIANGNTSRAAFFWADYDLDGLEDAFAITGDKGALLRNEGDGSFTDATVAACLDSDASVRQVAWSDYDGDGWVDLLTVGADGTLNLWWSNSGTCFESRSIESGLSRLEGVSAATWLDYDKDGLLDLHLVQGEFHRILHGSKEGVFTPARTGLMPPTIDQRIPGSARIDIGPGANRGRGIGNVPTSNSGGSTNLSGPGGPSSATAPGNFITPCAANLNDQATGQCIPASSIPTIGMLYPLGSEFNIDSTTGHVGIGLTSPESRLHVKGNTGVLRLEGSTHAYMTWYPETGAGRKGFVGYGSAGTNNLTLANEAAGDLVLSSQQDIALFGKVGVGTSSPGQGFTIALPGDDLAGGFEAPKWQASVGEPAGANVAIGSFDGKPAIQGHGTGTGFDLSLNPTAGKVGIGTTNPAVPLHVADSDGILVGLENAGMYLQGDADVSALSPGGSSAAARITNRKFHHLVIDIEANDGGDSFAIRTDADLNGTVDTIAMVVKPSGNVGIGTTTPSQKLDVNGRVKCKSVEITGGADLVEGFDSSAGPIEAGTVVVIDAENPGKLISSTTAYDTKVAGVVSGAGGVAHGLRMGQDDALDGDTLVAMTGRVWVKCSVENGAIEPGDLLTTASLPGRAMKSSDYNRAHGSIIGKAMSCLDEGTGLVLVLVNLQ